MRRRLPFASYFTGSAFFAASLVTACQNSDPAPLSQTASPVEEEGPPDYIDFSSTSWREIGAPYPMLEHKAAPLENGRILVTGGVVQTPSQETTAAAYVFTPGSDTWDAVGPMVTSRASHSATTLEDGRVLVFGGTLQGEDLYQFHASSEVFDPITATWTDLPTGFSFGWAGHTAVRLDDGSVLAFGGFYDDGVTRAAGLFTLYDGPPGYWYSTLWLPQPRYGHAATVAPTGSVFLTGGFNSQYAPSDVVYRLAPHEYGDWEEYGYLAEARVFHTATALKDGRILVAGGQDASGLPLKSTQFVEEAPPIYSSSITPLAAQPPAPLLIERVSHTAGLLPDGRVIVVGGRGLNGPLASTEIFDPATLTWSLGPELQVPRSHHEMVIHAGRIFVVGGMDDDWQALASVEVLEFGKSNGETCSDDAACLSGHCVDGVCCDTACEGACVACTAALKGSGADGVCGGVVDGTNPRSACEGGEVCQAGVCVAPSACAGQPDGTECGAGKVCENGACVDAPTECEGQANGTICSIGDGCTMGICQQGSCVETHKLDGTRCEGGICVAGECKADPHVAPTTGAGGSGGSATGGSGSDDGTGPGNGSGSASDDGGGCRIARGSESSSPVALSAALLTGLALLRRRSASRARA